MALKGLSFSDSSSAMHLSARCAEALPVSIESSGKLEEAIVVGARWISVDKLCSLQLVAWWKGTIRKPSAPHLPCISGNVFFF